MARNPACKSAIIYDPNPSKFDRDAIDCGKSWMAINWSLVKQNHILNQSKERKEEVKFENQ